MSVDDNYVPTVEDIAWLYRMLWKSREGDTVYIQLTGLGYQLSFKDKTLTLLNPQALKEEFNGICHRRLIKICREVGFQVLVRE